MQISELRHLDGVKGNFGISEKGYTTSSYVAGSGSPARSHI